MMDGWVGEREDGEWVNGQILIYQNKKTKGEKKGYV